MARTNYFGVADLDELFIECPTVEVWEVDDEISRLELPDGSERIVRRRLGF